MTTFSDLGLPLPIVRVLNDQGITSPFPIQAAAIPDALAGKDVLGRGPTGSGKTFTFGLPMLTKLATTGASRPGHPRGLVLAPTRELAAQIRERLSDPAAALGLHVLDVVGGVSINRNIQSLARPVDLLVATPGRAQDLINQRIISFDDVQITAIDEADHMADMGFLPQVRKLLDLTPADGQRLLFSATLDGDVDKLVQRYLTNPITHSTAPVQAAVDTMAHYRLLVGDRDNRNDVVVAIAARAGKTVMFMRTKHGVDRQVKKLRRVGINAVGIHGDKGQNTRTSAIEGFTSGDIPVLVATDIAARGIDISGVSLVVHIDPPAEHKAYLHRSGRTARAGTTGAVVTLVLDEQRAEVEALIKKAGVNAKEFEVTANSAKLIELTGARTPSGKPLPPPGQQAAQARPAQGTRTKSRKPRGKQDHANQAQPTHKAGESSGPRRRRKAASTEPIARPRNQRGPRRNSR
ncbi:DEAD/DEAH box helicase [Corynebacterium epidermidicanis]|uniref:DNA/RNA helicase, superfamily II n=1 Tax=Corynebacterium epidermidicanis TaxID=1050174 RepID=A0A0G3GU53_9CORY|nr:DEAD/DEAH box helicase [Corynebacterium epidermidicanis]AKK03093.1 DNA/RNA helicase, superfamily II [Corynebacterium epidermidicanis]